MNNINFDEYYFSLSYNLYQKIKMKKSFLALLVALFALCILTVACVNKKASSPKNVLGTLEEALTEDPIPDNVKQALMDASKFHQHEILNDAVNGVNVWSIDEIDNTSSEGYGIVVVKGSESTTFPHFRNVRQPRAKYMARTGDLWLVTSAMEGSGVQVERLRRLRFDDNGHAYVAAEIDPYTVQQAFCKQLSYIAAGDSIMLFVNDSYLAMVKNTVSDMGGFDDDAVWVGEQITYDLSGRQPKVLVTPGVKFQTGLVLHFDDMPTLAATVTEDSSDVVLSDIVIDEKSDSYVTAICRFLTTEIGSYYLPGEFCVPSYSIVGVKEAPSGETQVWGDFWLFNYNQIGDTLKMVSGGNHPGCMHVSRSGEGCVVTGFDYVIDGADNLRSAKEIFGDKYEAFHAINSNQDKRERVRAEQLAEYVKANGLTATMYQDYGWPAIALPLSE